MEVPDEARVYQSCEVCFLGTGCDVDPLYAGQALAQPPGGKDVSPAVLEALQAAAPATGGSRSAGPGGPPGFGGGFGMMGSGPTALLRLEDVRKELARISHHPASARPPDLS